VLGGEGEGDTVAEVEVVVGEDAGGEADAVATVDGYEAFRAHVLIGKERRGDGVGGAGGGDAQMFGADAEGEVFIVRERPADGVGHGKGCNGEAVGLEL